MNNRKDEHVALALKHHQMDKRTDFDDLKFVYNSLSSVDVEDVDLSVNVCGIHFEYPFFINAMTGGSAKTKDINRRLARVSKATGIAMASGSLSAAIKDSSQVSSFNVIREENKAGIILANLGAEYTSKEASLAIEMLDANLLQVHINLIQELVMPEGDRSFKKWSDNIKDIISQSPVPVIIKEVGFGMSKSTISSLKQLGAKGIDVSGAGGTNFVTIENDRRENKEYTYLEDFGLSTPLSLLEAYDYSNDIDIIASGGIRNPLDIIKALSLNAKAVGVSGLILKTLMDKGEEETIQLINRWKYELKIIMTLLGCQKVSDLKMVDLVLQNSVKSWCEERGIDTKHFAQRSHKYHR